GNGRELAKELAKLRNDLRDVSRSRTELGLEPSRIAGLEIGAEHLHPGPERRRARALVRAAAENQAAPLARVAGEKIGDPRLADPRLADQHEEAAVAGESFLEAAAKPR